MKISNNFKTSTRNLKNFLSRRDRSCFTAQNHIFSHGVNTWKYTKRRYFGGFSDISVIWKCYISVSFLRNENKEMSIFLHENKENIAFSINGNIWKFRKTISSHNENISILGIFVCKKNVTTWRNHHFFKSFFIKQNKKWHLETCFFGNFACNFSKDYLSWAWKIRKYSKIIAYL